MKRRMQSSSATVRRRGGLDGCGRLTDSAPVIRNGAGNDVVLMRPLLLTALLGGALLAGCGSDDSATTTATPAAAAPAQTTSSVAIEDFLYSPTPATVKAGTKITVPNADSAPHTLTDSASERAFDSGTIKGGASGSVTFTTTGTFSYFCEFHPYMKGSITVVK